jgi:hypothetical protein
MSWKNSAVLEVRLKDEVNKTIYKAKVNASDTKRVSLILETLQSLGINVIEAFANIINNPKEKDTGWFE